MADLLKPSLHGIAEEWGLTDEQLVQKILVEKQVFTADFTKKLLQIPCTTMPGGLWGWPEEVSNTAPEEAMLGKYLKPHPSRQTEIMVICPHPSIDGTHGNSLPVPELRTIMNTLVGRIPDLEPEDLYCAYAVPFYPHEGKMQVPFITAFQPILKETIARINPKTILVLGSSSLKGLFGSKGLVGNFQGQSHELYEGIPVYYTVDPYKLITNPSSEMSLELDLERIVSLMGGEEMPWDKPQDYKNYRFVESADELKKIVTDVMIEYVTGRYVQHKPLRIAVDCEWGNLHGREGVAHDIVRYIQFSVREHAAITVALTDPDLVQYPDYEEKVALLKALFEMEGVELCGHNFKVDLIHMMAMGIDCRKNYAFDTMTAYHMLKPQTESIGLTYCALEYTDLGMYENRLTDYIKGTPGLKAHTSKHGYSKIPDNVLSVYSCKDVDAVIQIWPQLEEALDSKKIGERYAGYVIDGKENWTQLDAYLNVVRKADAGIFEPEFIGMPADLPLMKNLQGLFSEKQSELIKVLEEHTWKGFDPDNQLLKAYLFGQRFCTKKLPEGIETLGLEPSQTTGKYPKEWASLDEEERLYESPGTGGDALTLLSHEYPEHEEMLDAIIAYKNINQVVKNFLRPPTVTTDEDGTETEVYDSGLIGCVDSDGSIRGTYLATTETSRFRSLKPNLNNLPGGMAEPGIRKQFALSDALFDYPNWKECDSRELVAAGLIDPRYDVVRSVIKAPKSYLIIGSDYAAAEIASVAYISGDENLIAISEDDCRDIHCETAVSAFGIKVPEGESVAEYVKSNHNNFRSSAKICLFGLIYGRSSFSLSKQLRVAGIEEADKAYAERVIDGIFNKYPRLKEYMDRQRAAVYSPGYAENPFGMRRYFFDSPSRSVMAAQERASINSVIQSTVSGILHLAMGNFAHYKELYPTAPFHVMAPFHDAVYSVVHYSFVDQYANEIVPWAMEEMAQVPSIGLKLKTDIEYEYHWSHATTKELAIAESLADV